MALESSTGPESPVFGNRFLLPVNHMQPLVLGLSSLFPLTAICARAAGC